MVTQLLKRTPLPKFTVRPLPVVGVTMLLFLIANLASYAAQLLPAERLLWAHLGFVALSTLSQYLAVALVAVMLYAGGVKLFRMLRGAFDVSDEAEDTRQAGTPDTTLPEAAQIQTSLQAITQTLARVEQDRNAATLLISDAQMQSAILISLIKAIAGKAEHYERQHQELAQAQEAIAGGDPVVVARAAGVVSDSHIRDLMLADIADPGYWLNVNRTIAAQSGSLTQWADGYKRFSGKLLLDFSRVKARLTALEAAGELVDVARPLAKIQSDLDIAGKQLQLNGRLGLETAGLLPELN